jgi:hypothetical protein
MCEGVLFVGLDVWEGATRMIRVVDPNRQNASTPQRSNASTIERLNESTIQRVNDPTVKRPTIQRNRPNPRDARSRHTRRG